MTLKKRVAAILVTALVAGGIYGIGHAGIEIKGAEEEEEAGDSVFGHKETLYLWYTDEALTDYLNSVALSYSEESEEVRVIPVYTSGLEYLEMINQASLQTEDLPDLYIVNNDSLEKAYLAGLASEVRLAEGESFEEIFPQTAVRAVTYRDKQIGYPFYFETSCFLYNKSYLEDWAKAQIEAQDIDISKEAVAAKVEEALPKTIDDILSFADTYDAPEQVEAVFKWDVSDIFYNYFFVGGSIDVGGVNGDRADSIHIYNEDAIRCLRVYQNLNQFFSIDTKEISYAGVLQDFLDGKIVYTVVTSDALGKLKQAEEEGTFTYEYGISKLPDVSGEFRSASLSVTECVAVNGYSKKKDMANDFALYLTKYGTESLYGRTGKLPVYTEGDTYDDPNVDSFMEEYESSVPMPKMIETSNFWVELEIAFAKIWDGEDANDDLKALSEKIMSQVLGEPYTEDYIDVPLENAEEEIQEGGEGEEETASD